MKETVNVNIASQAFTLDADAYSVLGEYLDQIREQLRAEDAETMEDIEARIAEIFRERIPSPVMVVTLATVQEAMAQMGRPCDFAGTEEQSDTSGTEKTAEPRRLTRSRTDRSIAGICGGIAEFFRIDPTRVRLITVALIFLGGLALWAYLILWFVIPEEPLRPYSYNRNKKQ